jgi:hypothetical protein
LLRLDLIEKEIVMEPMVNIRAALNDIALIIGSAADLHQLDDNLVWSVMKKMDRIRIRLFRELKGLPPSDWYAPEGVCPPRLHPAVKKFILRNGDGMGES